MKDWAWSRDKFDIVLFSCFFCSQQNFRNVSRIRFKRGLYEEKIPFKITNNDFLINLGIATKPQWLISNRIGSASTHRRYSLKHFGAICRTGFVSAFCTTLMIPKLFQSWPVLYSVNVNQTAQAERGALSPSDSLLLHIRTSLAFPLGASDTSLQRGPLQSHAFKMESLIQYQTSH